MVNIDVPSLRRYVFAGGGSAAARDLLRVVTVEELVLYLASLDEDRFITYEAGTNPELALVNDRYIGALVVRVLELLLEKTRLASLFRNRKVMELLSQRVSTSCLEVRRLFAKKCLVYFKGGGSNEQLHSLLWELLFDKDYCVFSSAASSICVIEKRRPGSICTGHLEKLVDLFTRVEDSDSELSVRVFEFCVCLGREDLTMFRTLDKSGLLDAMFKFYLESDLLVKINCLNIWDMSPRFLDNMYLSERFPCEILDEAMSVLESAEHGPCSNDLLVPPLFRFLLVLFSETAHMESHYQEAFGSYISRIILRCGPQQLDPVFLLSLGCFGRIYLLRCTTPEVCDKVESILSATNQEDVYSAIMSSMTTIVTGNLSPSDQPFLVAMTRTSMRSLSRFPISDVRTDAFRYLDKGLKREGLLPVMLDEECSSRVLSTEESLYENTIEKNHLVRQMLQLIERDLPGNRHSSTAECVVALKRYLKLKI